MAEERFTLTRAGYEYLQRELEAAQGEQREEFEELADYQADDDSDFPDQEVGAFFELQVTKEHDDQRVNYLKFVLERAEIIEEDPDPLRVNPGERVTVWDFDEQKERQFDLMSSPEVRFGLEGVSIESPVGQALLGRRVGDVVEVEIPDGKARYAIRRVEPIPQEM
jgi:transcription elongation factor GreA